ncbi:MAG: hypothetical protein ACK4G5_12035 [Devosia sp.]
MFRIEAVGLAGFLFLAAAAGHAQAACTNFAAPSVLSDREFSATAFGTMALRYGDDRFLAFETLGCFDVSRFALVNRKLYLNSTSSDVQPTYLLASVSRACPYEMRSQPALSLELYRNNSERTREDVWIGVTVDESEYEGGAQVPGTEFGILYAAFESDPIDVDALGGYGAMDLGEGSGPLETWHALLSNVSGVPSPHERYPVLANTRKSIEIFAQDIESMRSEAVKTLLTKMYLVKFLPSPSPSFDAAVLEPGIGDCVVVRYRIGGELEPPIEQAGSDLLVLKFDKDAPC